MGTDLSGGSSSDVGTDGLDVTSTEPGDETEGREHTSRGPRRTWRAPQWTSSDRTCALASPRRAR